MEFENNGGVDTIEIIAPGSDEKKIPKANTSDPRKIGIGLVRLRIKDLDKPL